MKPVGKPDAGNRHVRFDERGEKTERCRTAPATASLLDSTRLGLTVYDATYVELALRLKLPIATLDRDIIGAAHAENIELIGLEE